MTHRVPVGVQVRHVDRGVPVGMSLFERERGRERREKKKSLLLLLGECIVVDINDDDDEKPMKKDELL